MLVTPDKVEYALKRFAACAEPAVDTETNGLRPFTGNRLVGMSVDVGDEAFYFPFRHGSGENLSWRVFEEGLRPLLSDPSKTYFGFNYGFDMKMFLVDGVPFPTRVRDVMLAGHLLNENEISFGLKKLSDRYLGTNSSVEEQRLKDLMLSRGLDPKADMWKASGAEVEPYACDDVRLTRRLAAFYAPYLDKWGLRDLWYELNEYLLAIATMESRGLLLDQTLMAERRTEALAKAGEMQQVIQKLAGYPINLNSPKQLQAWLGLKSTAHDVLEEIPDRPGVTELRKFRKWSRVESNYIRKFLEVKSPSGRVHPNFNMIGTISGRLSAKDPPMQAIPRNNDPDGIYRIKDLFVADEGNVLWEADLSQAEIRVATHFSGEENMRSKLLRGADIHTETAEETHIPRDFAKRLNFSVIYGIGWKTLSENLKIPAKQAKEYLDKYHANYPGFRRLYNRAEAVAEHKGYIRLFSGRLRHFNSVSAPTHKASSNLVQGSVAEMVRVAIQRLHRQGVAMHLQIHDSIVGECRESEVKDVLRLVSQAMTDQAWCSVPMKVDCKAGRNWGAAKKVEL